MSKIFRRKEEIFNKARISYKTGIFYKEGAPCVLQEKKILWLACFRESPSTVFNIDTMKAIGSLYLLGPFLQALGIRDIVDRIVPMERNIEGWRPTAR